MKRSLLFKLILCFFICSAGFFGLVNSVGSYYVKSKIIESRNAELSRTGGEIVDTLSKLKINPVANTATTNSIAEQISKTFDCTVIITNSDRTYKIQIGDNVTYDNSSITYQGKFTDASDVIYHLSMYRSTNCIEDVYSNIMTLFNLITGALCVIVALIFILVYFLTIHPVHKITQAAKEYSKGNFAYDLKIKQNDEYLELGNAIKYMAGELNNLDDYQRKFIGNISHDFRSPLTSILGYVGAMLDGTIPPENQEKYLGIIQFEAERLSGLMTNLLTLYNFDNNKKLLNKQNFDINYIIKKTAQTYEGICEKKKIEFVFKMDTEELFVNADQPKIQQVLNNLIDNAIKFSPQYSKIILSTYEKGEKVFVSIKDSGIGIPKDSINRIWERFYKSDPSRGKDKKGTGLGLAITKEIIQSHNENIDVISTEGVGTEFIFTVQKKQVEKDKDKDKDKNNLQLI